MQGPAVTLVTFFQQIKWELINTSSLRTHKGEVLEWLNIGEGYLLHELRDALKLVVWSRQLNRADMPELAKGTSVVDYEATTQLLRVSKHFTKFQQGLLRTFTSGAINTQERIAVITEQKAARGNGSNKEPLSRTCPLCGQGVENTAHILDQCAHPKMLNVRENYTTQRMRYNYSDLPTCLKLCGIAIMDERDEALRLAIPKFEGHDWPAERTAGDSEAEVWTDDGYLVVAGDGACHHQQHSLCRRAGYGAYYGRLHSANFSLALPGSIQNAQRAEVQACDRVLAHSWCPAEYWTDSEL